jgi:hypothetical protein
MSIFILKKLPTSVITNRQGCAEASVITEVFYIRIPIKLYLKITLKLTSFNSDCSQFYSTRKLTYEFYTSKRIVIHYVDLF